MGKLQINHLIYNIDYKAYGSWKRVSPFSVNSLYLLKVNIFFWLLISAFNSSISSNFLFVWASLSNIDMVSLIMTFSGESKVLLFFWILSFLFFFISKFALSYELIFCLLFLDLFLAFFFFFLFLFRFCYIFIFFLLVLLFLFFD